MNETHVFSKVHAEEEIENAKLCVPGKCCVASMNFESFERVRARTISYAEMTEMKYFVEICVRRIKLCPTYP